MRDIFSAINEVLLLLCGGERKQILNLYNELLVKCDKLIKILNEFQLSNQDDSTIQMEVLRQCYKF